MYSILSLFGNGAINAFCNVLYMYMVFDTYYLHTETNVIM